MKNQLKFFCFSVAGLLLLCMWYGFLIRFISIICHFWD